MAWNKSEKKFVVPGAMAAKARISVCGTFAANKKHK